MPTNQIIGIALIAAGVADAGVSFFVDRFVPQESARNVVRGGLIAGAVAMVGAGTAFLTGALG